MEHPFYGMPPSMMRRHTTALEPPKRLRGIARAASSNIAWSSGDLRGLASAPQELLQHRPSVPSMASSAQGQVERIVAQEKSAEEDDQDDGSDVMTTMNEDEEQLVYDDVDDAAIQEEEEAQANGVRLSKETMFIVAAWIVLFTSGGLILGCVTFAALLTRTGLTNERIATQIRADLLDARAGEAVGRALSGVAGRICSLGALRATRDPPAVCLLHQLPVSERRQRVLRCPSGYHWTTMDCSTRACYGCVWQPSALVW